jgi:Uma2 family endonuclease
MATRIASQSATAHPVKTNGESLSRPPRMTFEEFLAWADEDTWAEWVDGEIIVLSPASLQHQKLDLWLASAFDTFVKERNSGIVLTAPFLMRLPTRPSGREPDILFVAREHLDRLKETYLDGPADLVVEIISPESRERDEQTKLREYEAGGVREYWLLDPLKERAVFYQLDENASYDASAPDADGIYHSRVLEGLWLRQSWLWQKPPPKLLDVLREWKLI